MALPSNYRQIALIGSSTSNSNTPQRRLPSSTSSGGSNTKTNSDHTSSSSPFSTPAHGNPNFAPQKLSGLGPPGSKANSASNDPRVLPKPPKTPDKPLAPYTRYSRKVWDQVKAENQDLKMWQISKIIGSKWRELPDVEKQPFSDEYETEKVEYEKAMKVYHASPAYQAYLTAKNKAAASNASASKEDESAGNASSQSKLDRRFDIQPAEDDDDYDDSVTSKHVSHARYVRNHRLINEVLSETMVPDVRSVVTAQRLSVLRRQVQSLTMHQKKLETELTQIEEKFESKKRKFLEAGDAFQRELKKVKGNAPRIDEAFYAGLIEREKLKQTQQSQQTSVTKPTEVANEVANSTTDNLQTESLV